MKLKIKEYDVIFMDINMPVKNGLEATAMIRQLCRNNEDQPYIVGLTGDASVELEEQCKAAGMNKICTVYKRRIIIVFKPVEKKMFEQLINELQRDGIIS